MNPGASQAARRRRRPVAIGAPEPSVQPARRSAAGGHGAADGGGHALGRHGVAAMARGADREAERARTQSTWILAGALDWARLILREHRTEHTSLHDAWAQPLAEARLSTFLATDRDNNADDGPEAFLSGQITDAQAKYNLRRLFANGQVAPEELKVLERLFQAGGRPLPRPVRWPMGWWRPGWVTLRLRWPRRGWTTSPGSGWMPPADTLRPLVLLPSAEGTAVNLNTAPREVLAAVVEKLDPAPPIASCRCGSARRSRSSTTSRPRPDCLGRSRAEAGGRAGGREIGLLPEVRGRLRLGDRVIEEVSIVHKRSPTEVVVVQRQRLANVLPR